LTGKKKIIKVKRIIYGGIQKGKKKTAKTGRIEGMNQVSENLAKKGRKNVQE